MNQEELLSKKRAFELYEIGKNMDFEVGTTARLQQIHQYLFQDIFDFAGQIRTVNIAKGNMRFTPVFFLEQNLKTIDTLPEATFEEIITNMLR